MMLERRKFVGQFCKTALTVVGGDVVAINAAHAAENQEGENDIGAIEDLMREHGVLRRVLLIYEERLRRIAAHQDFPGNLFLTGAQLIRKFVEDYHEKNEGKFIFPELPNNLGEAGHGVEAVAEEERALGIFGLERFTPKSEAR